MKLSDRRPWPYPPGTPKSVLWIYTDVNRCHCTHRQRWAELNRETAKYLPHWTCQKCDGDGRIWADGVSG